MKTRILSLKQKLNLKVLIIILLALIIVKSNFVGFRTVILDSFPWQGKESLTFTLSRLSLVAMNKITGNLSSTDANKKIQMIFCRCLVTNVTLVSAITAKCRFWISIEAALVVPTAFA